MAISRAVGSYSYELPFQSEQFFSFGLLTAPRLSHSHKVANAWAGNFIDDSTTAGRVGKSLWNNGGKHLVVGAAVGAAALASGAGLVGVAGGLAWGALGAMGNSVSRGLNSLSHYKSSAARSAVMAPKA